MVERGAPRRTSNDLVLLFGSPAVPEEATNRLCGWQRTALQRVAFGWLAGECEHTTMLVISKESLLSC
jgi:hypothetical protein